MSQVFAAAVLMGEGVEVGPVDPALEPRIRAEGGPVALAYSGGVDCTAALEVLGPETRCYYQQRHRFDDKPLEGTFDTSAALAAVEHIRGLGVRARVVQTDLELLRDPVGFPHDLANIAPALLWSDEDGTSAVCWGTVLTSATLLGAKAYRPYEDSAFVAGFGPAFQAVGMPVANVIAGVSEEGTHIITEKSAYGRAAASCQHGLPGRPCMQCWKCGRKTLSIWGLADRWPSGREIDHFLQQPQIARNLRRRPIRVEVALAWAAGVYARSSTADGESKVMQALHHLTQGADASPLTSVFLPAMDPLPDRLRDRAVESVTRYLPLMSPEEEQWVREWTIEQHGDPATRDAAWQELDQALDPEVNPTGISMSAPLLLAPPVGPKPSTEDMSAASEPPESLPPRFTRLLAWPKRGYKKSDGV
ncbi:DUF6395 domain-containing protein [Kytococcus schroeteri]|uniref:DUF6395 domain-containing protein n=1 Tax=Kytococcus schroeteri TaxID=138300 RepID=UPI0035E7B279